MAVKSNYRLAILGCGTVGAELIRQLTECAPQCTRRAGRALEIAQVAVADPSRPRTLPPTLAARLHGDADAACVDPEVDLVVEVAGGVEAPRRWIRSALAAGKDVVTANKAVLAEHGDELFGLAHESGRKLLFEAAVAGAIPILQSIQGGLPPRKHPLCAADTLHGILNGTCNHVLGWMQEGDRFNAAVARAQQAGFAEADPSLDLSGADAAHKLALLARLLTGRGVHSRDIPCEGIERVTPEDLAFGRRHRWVLKQLAILDCADGGVRLSVAPTWIDDDSPLAAVRGEDNGILLGGAPFGFLFFQGKGAGGAPTAGCVLADIVRAARGEGQTPYSDGELPLLDPRSEAVPYAVRFEVEDRPGRLASIAHALGEENVSILGMEQPEAHPPERVPIYMVTHPVAAAPLTRALDRLVADAVVDAPPLCIRVAGRCDTDGRAR